MFGCCFCFVFFLFYFFEVWFCFVFVCFLWVFFFGFVAIQGDLGLATVEKKGDQRSDFNHIVQEIKSELYIYPLIVFVYLSTFTNKYMLFQQQKNKIAAWLFLQLLIF